MVESCTLGVYEFVHEKYNFNTFYPLLSLTPVKTTFIRISNPVEPGNKSIMEVTKI
jgi:hypothetical protein